MSAFNQEQLKELEELGQKIETKAKSAAETAVANYNVANSWWQRARRAYPLGTQNVLIFVYGPLMAAAGFAVGRYFGVA